MKLSIPVVETIKKRNSVRTYEKRPLSETDRKAVQSYMEQLDNPFGVTVKKYMTDSRLNEDGEKLGTYGVIKGASTFLGISVPDTEMAPIAAGYEFENLILYATNRGLGTVWLAATFNRDRFSSVMDIPKEHLFPAVSPIGYPASKRSLTENIMRSAMKASQRKEWKELFYQDNFHTALTKEEAGIYKQALEMVRLAPSAKNAQPWRVCKSGNTYHFYVTYKPGIFKGEEMIKKVDMGIALSHFHQTVLEEGMRGKFEVLPEVDIPVPDHTYYVISWCAE